MYGMWSGKWEESETEKIKKTIKILHLIFYAAQFVYHV